MLISVKVNDIVKNITLYRTCLGECPSQDKYILMYKNGFKTPITVMELVLGPDVKFVDILKQNVTEDPVSLTDKLGFLAFRVIDANQQGVDINDISEDYVCLGEAYQPQYVRVDK